MVSKFPTLSLKKISISPKTTAFILLGIGIVFISLLYYTFETLLVFGLVYLISIPVSFFMYKNKQNTCFSALNEIKLLRIFLIIDGLKSEFKYCYYWCR